MHPGCGKSFTDNAHLRDHTFVHTGEKNLSCELCGKRFARLSTLHDHQRVHSGEKPYACALPGCSKRYSSRAALRFHIAGHASTNRSVARRNTAESSDLYQDDDRYEAFPQSAAHHHHEPRQSPTRQHQQPEHGGDPSETQLLHAKLRRQETQIAELQAQLHKLKRKAKTSKTTTTSSTAASLAPPMVAPVVYLMDGMKPFQCFVCYHRFANYYQLSFHAKQHPDASIANVARNQEPLPVGPKYCPEPDCEYNEAARKPLKNLQTLKRHWQRRHQLARPYVCAMCSPANPKSFKTKENLKAHEKECAKTSTRHGAVAATGITNTMHREVAEAM
uniref:C2H2-type domain-containing protein n=1 Tax=Globisporangium ultimum (strain ATCC 200006 / CBS 805.95 / DAOM BR144) TaxID=431595 RepID=K3X6G2_GLOUD